MTTENTTTPNPYAHESDTIELSVSEMQNARAIYNRVEVTVKSLGQYKVRGQEFKQVTLQEVNGFWNPPHELSVGAKGIAILSINKIASGTLYHDIQDWEQTEGGVAVAPAQKVSVPVATSGNSMDGRNRSIEKQVGVKALIELAPHCEALVSAGFMKSETAARVIRQAVLGAEELLGELSENDG
tara:strand:+ start:578 stop:1132 length:555 start_codon:yes stop_codon:yes gene_type:complete